MIFFKERITLIQASWRQNAETQKWREMRVFVSYRRTKPVPKERCLYPITMIRSYSLMLRIWKLLLIIVENNWKILKHKFLLYGVKGSIYYLCSQITIHPIVYLVIMLLFSLEIEYYMNSGMQQANEHRFHYLSSNVPIYNLK